jgi:hypothetical protein
VDLILAEEKSIEIEIVEQHATNSTVGVQASACPNCVKPKQTKHGGGNETAA